MATVVLTSTLGKQFAHGESRFEIEARNVRELLKLLDARFPGLGNEIENAHGLAIDGEFVQDPLMEAIGPHAEVFVLPKIAGG